MRGHTRTHRTSQSKNIDIKKDYMTVDEFHEECFTGMPKWAVFLAGLRCREGLTQKQLGKIIDVSPKNISNMEHGRRPIGKNIAKRLAEVLDIDYRFFL